LALGAPARADVTGSFDGAVTAKKLPQAVAAAAVFSEVIGTVSGTVALPGDLATLGGAYLVVGKATPTRIKVAGTGPGGARFKWRAKILGDTLTGRATVKAPGSKLSGTLAMTRNVFTSDGSSCDAVYQANQTFFDEQVLGQALSVCGTCHASGLQAAATRLHVAPNDPLATARATALFVDAANPSASRLLEKPLNVVPHGGGIQLAAGSAEAQALAQWVDLIAQAQCQ
jgi:hypothetical protein